MNRRVFTKLAAISPLSFLYSSEANANEKIQYGKFDIYQGSICQHGKFIEVLFYATDRNDALDFIMQICEKRLGRKISPTIKNVFKKQCYNIYKKYGRVSVKAGFKRVAPSLSEPYWVYQIGQVSRTMN